MKGSNTILLNTEEMNRAIEYYLNNVQLKEPVTVDKVESDWNSGAITGFRISVSERTDGTRDTQS